jgi:hypothetical protein
MKRFQIAIVGMIVIIAPRVSCTQTQNDLPNVAAPSAATSNVPVLPASPASLSVVCKGDQLTIQASNSSLSTILAEVSKCSGAKIDSSEVSAKGRFFETIGPGPMRDVLSSLLDDSGLNYVIQTSASNPQRVETVLLLARVEHSPLDGSGDASLPRGRRAALRSMPENTKEAEESTPENEPPAAEPPPPSDNPALAAPAISVPPATPASPPSADSLPVSAPTNLQDRITDMQQMFEQRKQMIQDQNSHQH